MKAYVIATATLFAAGCTCTQPTQTADNRRMDESSSQSDSSARTAFMGSRGADGPAGPTGPQGRTGDEGPAGYAMAGPRGAVGPMGPEGPPGRLGERGAAGEIVVGPRGETGAVGPAGAAGAAGETGQRGASGEGLAGPVGRAGPAGPQGRVGDTGPQGPPLVGPAGPAGRTGVAGPTGVSGQTGAQGQTTPGVAGVVGAVGPTGPAGDVGPAGDRGVTGIVERWVVFREFWFDPSSPDVHTADRAQFAEIAAYMRSNPSLELGIDGSTNPRATLRRDIDLGTNRVNAIRAGLIASGVPTDRITAGFYGDQNSRRDQKVDVLLRSTTGSSDRRNQQDQAPLPTRVGEQTQTARYDASMPAEVPDRWTAIRTFWFDCDSHDVHSSDRMKIEEIAEYTRRNRSIEIGIDNTLPQRDGAQVSVDRDDALRRGSAVRDALIAAGVPASRIRIGALGDPNQRRAGRVEVLIRSGQLAQAP